MEIVGTIELTFIRDRNINKIRVNLIKDGAIFGFIKPTNLWK
jgi:hypothetical protein